MLAKLLVLAARSDITRLWGITTLWPVVPPVGTGPLRYGPGGEGAPRD
jgi:hypothetical protein